MSPAKLAAGVVAAVVLLGSAGTAIAALITLSSRDGLSTRSVPANTPRAVIDIAPDPIRSESDVFRTSPTYLAINPASDRQRWAHPRTLKTYRALRAYPGAPPRIPHGLNPDEALRGGCKTCHERGGYSHRFEAYVPVTPHPDMGMCLQCHVGDFKLMSIPMPTLDPSTRCRQCHSEGGARWRDSATTFRPLSWTDPVRTDVGDAPPPIPHSLQMRTNCLTCHAAPSAVAELRTTHPTWSNCRSCHVESARTAGEFVR